MKSPLPNTRFLPSARFMIGLTLACALLGPMKSNAAENATTFPAVGELPAQAAMPDPLLGSDGKRITAPAQWQARREEMKRIIEQYREAEGVSPEGVSPCFLTF